MPVLKKLFYSLLVNIKDKYIRRGFTSLNNTVNQKQKLQLRHVSILNTANATDILYAIMNVP